MTLKDYCSPCVSIKWHEFEANIWGFRFQYGKHLRIDRVPTAGSQMNLWYMGNVWTWRWWCDLLLLFFSTIKCLNRVSRLSKNGLFLSNFKISGWFFFPLKEQAVNCLLQPKFLLNFALFFSIFWGWWQFVKMCRQDVNIFRWFFFFSFLFMMKTSS